MRAPAIEFNARLETARMGGIALLVLGVAVVAAGVWQQVATSRELERIEADIRSATGAADKRRAARARAAPQMAEAKISAINNAIARLNVPWNELFAAIETERPKEVGLLALLPDPRKRVLIVQAETLTARAMIDFVDRLRAMPSFTDAVLVKHERREQDVGQPYRFAIEVHWKEER